jgi:hypothetical protein
MKKTALLSLFLLTWVVPANVQAATFKNCTALNKVYPSGVAKSAAAARKQKNPPKISAAIYKAHSKMDRDKDGAVCEK